jgi:hypothetical protein
MTRAGSTGPGLWICPALLSEARSGIVAAQGLAACLASSPCTSILASAPLGGSEGNSSIEVSLLPQPPALKHTASGWGGAGADLKSQQAAYPLAPKTTQSPTGLYPAPCPSMPCLCLLRLCMYQRQTRTSSCVLHCGVWGEIWVLRVRERGGRCKLSSDLGAAQLCFLRFLA